MLPSIRKENFCFSVVVIEYFSNLAPSKCFMSSRKNIHQNCLHFSCWSKKGYSIFAGLGREVRISRLATSMYENVLLKSASHGVIINTDASSEAILLAVWTRECEEFDSRRRGEVCPDDSSINKPKRDILLAGVYPFFIRNKSVD